MSVETQAVRVAAVAAALVEDAQTGAAPRPAAPAGVRGRRWWKPSEMVLDMIREERARHAARWGAGPLLPGEWLMILAVEAGALAEAVPGTGTGASEGAAGRARHHLAQAGVEARAWLEARGRPAGTA